jgi:hypothetical protein
MAGEKTDDDHPGATNRQYQPQHDQEPRENTTHCRAVPWVDLLVSLGHRPRKEYLVTFLREALALHLPQRGLLRVQCRRTQHFERANQRF